MQLIQVKDKEESIQNELVALLNARLKILEARVKFSGLEQNKPSNFFEKP